MNSKHLAESAISTSVDRLLYFSGQQTTTIQLKSDRVGEELICRRRRRRRLEGGAEQFRGARRTWGRVTETRRRCRTVQGS